MIKPINFSSKILIPQNFLTKTKKVKKLNATAIPFVTAPIVAYWSTQKNKELREKTINNEIEKSKKLNSSHHPVKDTTETNTEALKKADFTDSEIAQHLNSKGEIKDQETKDLLKSKHIKFKGSTDDQHFDSADTSYNGETYGDMPKVYEPETGIQGFPQPAGVTNFDDAISGTSVSEQLAEVADMLDNPVLTGVVAELLPGTKFFKPAKDLFDGDIEKAA